LDNKDFQYDYRFEVFDNSMINAFTLPGGIILISKGLLEFADSPEEVAAVIAHEMGHVENRDVIRRLIRELSINILLSQDTYVLSEVSKNLSSNSYSRKQETAADEFALKTLEESNIEPRILATFFRKIKDKEGDLPPYLEAFSSHPNFSSRITYCLEYQPGEGFEEEDFDMNWEEVKSRLFKLDRESVS
jgi:predicted Zn-dependent protease